jgi:hypothetical protein
MKCIVPKKVGQGLITFSIMVYKIPIISCETEETQKAL